uniref:Uncharacterized protein n=1 Tax=Lepeophtheirus salmonis TaxID=72036 RepID=A0A0K2T812_LEPSM
MNENRAAILELSKHRKSQSERSNVLGFNRFSVYRGTVRGQPLASTRSTSWTKSTKKAVHY